ncbi:SOS response-associated peptidase [Micrococcus terreus]|uniref:SOS response-associated peptidase n=1 Tax=Micrococcus terreus TaxID=574650 RepID=UPI0021A82797|nr:SOS response-associated peptidase [Micrococcus terreus]MCT2087983.1 SOS response-associated peptidase [Micrococcus terreus]
MDERENRLLITGWMRDWGGKASTSREQKKGINLHPLILPAEGSGRTLALAWWWLHVGGVPAKFQAFNSRDDALATKWKGPFQHRALIPLDWYSEGGKRWALPDGQLFAIAAITSPRRNADGSETISYSMVTRHGIGEAASVISSRGESRMPLILPREMHDEWLDPDRHGNASLVAEAQEASVALSQAVVVSESQRNTFSRRSLWQFHGINAASRIQCCSQARQHKQQRNTST